MTESCGIGLRILFSQCTVFRSISVSKRKKCLTCWSTGIAFFYWNCRVNNNIISRRRVRVGRIRNLTVFFRRVFRTSNRLLSYWTTGETMCNATAPKHTRVRRTASTNRNNITTLSRDTVFFVAVLKKRHKYSSRTICAYHKFVRIIILSSGNFKGTTNIVTIHVQYASRKYLFIFLFQQRITILL